MIEKTEKILRILCIISLLLIVFSFGMIYLLWILPKPILDHLLSFSEIIRIAISIIFYFSPLSVLSALCYIIWVLLNYRNKIIKRTTFILAILNLVAAVALVICIISNLSVA
jgi:hypothetical protein